MKKYFITGTDTNCGKTYVVGELLKTLNKTHKVQALKPVASGCEVINGELINEDITRLQQDNANPNLAINQWQYNPPISPHLAAQLSNERISVKEIASFCQQAQFKCFDQVLIEGAGGLLVPLNEQETWLDFLKLTQIPVILIVGLRLGCINHALLTDSVLKINQIACLGWIANHLDEEMLYQEENINTLKQRLSIPLIGQVFHKSANKPMILDQVLKKD